MTLMQGRRDLVAGIMKPFQAVIFQPQREDRQWMIYSNPEFELNDPVMQDQRGTLSGEL